MKMVRRIISGLLAMCMAVSMLPMDVWAEEIIIEDVSATEAVVETTAALEMEVTEHVVETTVPDVTAATDAVETIAEENAFADAVNSVLDSGTCGNAVTWELTSDGVLTISGTGPMKNYYHDYYDGITYAPWYSYRKRIQSAVITEGVTCIGAYSFYMCNLSSVIIPDSVTSINEGAFNLCSNLTEVILPDGLTTIGYKAFEGCRNLAEIVIPASVTSIWADNFSSCIRVHISDLKAWCNINFSESDSNPLCGNGELILNGELLTDIVVPEDITQIKNYAFYGYKRLNRITIPDGVTSIGQYAFYNCAGLSNVSIPDSVSNIGQWAFKGCSSLTSITIPDGVRSISRSAFMECTNLNDVVIPDGVTTIETYAFYKCYGLTNITIPASVRYIQSYAFQNCSNLTEIYYGGTEEQWEALKGSLGSDNEPLKKAMVYFNGEKPIRSKYVLYYLDWEEAENRAYFGIDDVVSYGVSEKTDRAFLANPTGLQGQYVLVETLFLAEIEILLNVHAISSKTGTVASADSSTITIDNTTYTTPLDLIEPESYKGKFVLYHVRDGVLLGIEALSEYIGYLTYWHEAGKTMNIQTNASSADGRIYRLSPLADDVSEEFLSWTMNDLFRGTQYSSTDVYVQYYSDSNRIIYEILPYVERWEEGFSAEKHGWPIVNDGWSCGYDMNNRDGIEASDLLVHSEGLKGLGTLPYAFVHSFGKKDGNCFGFSLLAIAQYNSGRDKTKAYVDMSPLFPVEGDTLNEFGYVDVEETDNGCKYVLYECDENNKGIWDENHQRLGNSEILARIEKAMFSQFSPPINDVEVFSGSADFSKLIDYLSGDNPDPLLIKGRYYIPGEFRTGNHVWVTETSYKPIYIGQGRYLVMVYDCNAPRLTNKLENQREYYSQPRSFLYFDLDRNCWYYVYNNEFRTGYNDFWCYDISALDQSFFDEHYKFVDNKTLIIFNAENIEVLQNEAEKGEQTVVFEYQEEPSLSGGDCTFIPYCSGDGSENVKCGGLILPEGDYIVKTGGKAYVQYMYDNDVFVYSTDGTIEAGVSHENDKITVLSRTDLANMQCVYASTAVDFCTAIDADVDSGISVSVVADASNKTASWETNAEQNEITVTSIIDGELAENITDIIHYHRNLIEVEGSVPTCVNEGRKEYFICSCGKWFEDAKATVEIVHEDQLVIPATGHYYIVVDGTYICSICGSVICMTIPQDYLSLTVNQSTELTAKVQPVELYEDIQWSVNNGEIISVDETGTVTALAVGTAYVTATVTDGEITLTDRCRVDVTEEMVIEGIQLSTNKLNVERYSTDYVTLEVLLKLPQNYSAQSVGTRTELPDLGVAIEAARFTDERIAELFTLGILDDRALSIVPTEKGMNEAKGKYTGTVTVTVAGTEYESEAITLTVKNTLPKLKATISNFNSFYSGQSQEITITGATVTNITATSLPNWLTLDGNNLILNGETVAKNASGKAVLQVETEEWNIPAAITLNVRNSYKAPGLKLSATSVNMSADAANSNGAQLKLIPNNKKDTLEGLKVTGITASNGYIVENFNITDGAFTLKAGENAVPGKITLSVSFANTNETLALNLTVKNTAVTLKLSATNITLNPDVGDAAKITVTATPADYRITNPTFRLEDNKKNDKLNSRELALGFANDTLTVSTTPSTPNGATYKLYISAGGSREVSATIKTVEKSPTMTLKATGNIDLSYPENEVVVTPTFKNYSGAAIEDWEYSVAEMKGKNVLNANAGAFFEVTKDVNAFRVCCTEPEQLTMGNTYQMTLKLTLPNGSICENTVKLTIKQTALKLKLSATTITLNKTIDDSAELTVTSTTKGYTLGTPVWQLMDKTGKNSADGKLDVAYNNGKLTVSVNEETQFGQSYKLLVKASEKAAATTLTVNIPAENRSSITGTIKLVGGIDVIRDGSSVTVTPTYKNCGNEARRTERLEIYSSADKYTEPVTELFEITRNENGIFIVTKSGAVNHTQKYQVKLVTDFGNGVITESKLTSLKVTMGTAKLTANADSTTMFAKDKNCRVTFTVTSTDNALNKVKTVEIKDKKYQNILEVIPYGNGEFAIGYKEGKVDSSLIGKTVTLNLNVFLEGNESTKVNGTVNLKLTFA
ncbi:MAG: leucine-rich repeat protein [Oscillospiraceae bacterium]|nr:leucine-rich repeat protein [Oscillospiraceae bacterium]